jgi:hypothetical protein
VGKRSTCATSPPSPYDDAAFTQRTQDPFLGGVTPSTADDYLARIFRPAQVVDARSLATGEWQRIRRATTTAQWPE